MALFKSDAQGFLVGEIIDNGRDLVAMQQQSAQVWRSIRNDVRAIARALDKQVATATRTSRPGAQAALARSPASAQSRVARVSRTAGGNVVGSQQVAQSQGRRAVVTSATASRSLSTTNAARTTTAVAVPVTRAANGRFVAGARAGGVATPGDGGGVVPPASLPATGGTIGRLTDTLGRLYGSLGAADNVDPTLNAAKEISDVVSPLGRGLFSMFGKSAERKKERWYDRILKALKPKGAAEATPAGGGGRGLLGGMGAMLASVPGMLMSVLMRVFLPIAAVWGSWELGKWIGEKLYKWLDDSGVMTKVFDAFDVIGESFSGAWTSVKSGIDTVVSGMEVAWKGIADGFKSALDGFMQFPAKIGEFFAGLDESMRNLPIIGKAYAAAADGIRSAGAAAKSGFTEGQDGKTSAAPTSAAQAIGRDVGKAATAVRDVGSQIGAGFDAGRNGGEPGAAPATFAQRAARAVGSAAGTATGWVLGQTSKRYESGTGGAGTVSSGKGDNGGASYGTYQLSSKMGTLDKFLKSSGYGAQFEGLTAGSKEFNAKWRDVAKNDATFGDKQHEFIKATHYDPMVAGLKKDGIDLGGRGAAVQDAAWSTSVQFGGSSKLIQKALAGRDAKRMSDAEIVTAIQDYKAANNDTLFKKSDANMRAGTLSRAMSEKDALLKIAAPSATIPSNAPPGAVALASLPAVQPTNIPSSVPDKLPKMEEIKEPPTRLNSGGGAGRGTVQINMPRDVGQNIGDRGIAHVTSGGLGAG